MILTRAPFRLSIGGGGTDLPFFYERYGGYLITSGISKYVYVALKERFEKELRISYSKTEIVDNIDSIQNTRAREALRSFNIFSNLEMATLADLPAETGVGASGTFLVALLHALHLFKGETVSKKRLAEEACKIEQSVLKYPSGKQDPYAASFGGMIEMKISRRGNVLVSPINIGEETVKQLEKNLVLYYTGTKRSSNVILKRERNELEKNEEKFDYLREIKKIGKKIKKSLERGDTGKFGRLLNYHWDLKKSISNVMSNKRINEIYEVALRNGALGGKLVGAGGGGFLLFYSVDQEKLDASLKKFGLRGVKFRFDFEGSKPLLV